jgi:hypothetical protein
MVVINPSTLILIVTTLWSWVRDYYPLKSHGWSSFWGKKFLLWREEVFALEGSVLGLLYDDILKSGFGLTILFLVLHVAHGQPPNQWMVFSTKSLYSWKLLTFSHYWCCCHKCFFLFTCNKTWKVIMIWNYLNIKFWSIGMIHKKRKLPHICFKVITCTTKTNIYAWRSV